MSLALSAKHRRKTSENEGSLFFIVHCIGLNNQANQSNQSRAARLGRGL